ncbi:YceI family protein [Chryseobacterium sp. JAH]|uniref:YceI family protein n=1 Tax=Chryseobacterium sp. JAH TaxID=1742858 RepID=UPI0009DD48AB|nr:YceI family protein [Chryseobacterium sp. JAH]
MKPLYMVLLFLFSTTMINAQENFVKINGSTNVSSFQFFNTTFKNDRDSYSLSEKNLPNIILKVSDFDCGNKMMIRDFRKMLNVEKYPEMTIRFLSLTKDQKNLLAVIEVKIMNQTKKYHVDFIIQNNKLIGRKSLKFSDFNITPPKKMGGMIVVKDDLDLILSLVTRI